MSVLRLQMFLQSAPILLLLLHAISSESQQDYELSYDLMTNAYNDEDWENCVNHGLAAVTQFKSFIQNVVGCRASCKQDPLHKLQRKLADPLIYNYGDSLREVTCIRRCHPINVANEELQHNFIMREPYDYIQLCYYKVSTIVPGIT